MPRRRLVVISLLVALVLAAGSAFAAVPKPTGTVGPGFTITLKQGGKKVTQLKAGRVSITIRDVSAAHNFHLSGPGDVDVATEVAEEGTESFTVDLTEAGEYLFVCDPHRESMNGMFVVE